MTTLTALYCTMVTRLLASELVPHASFSGVGRAPYFEVGSEFTTMPDTATSLQVPGEHGKGSQCITAGKV